MYGRTDNAGAQPVKVRV